MKQWIPWFILGLICLVILLAYRKYTTVSVAPEPEPEPDTDTNTEAFASSSPEIPGNLRVCKVYYTSNMDICNRSLSTDESNTVIDAGNMNYYQLNSNVVEGHIQRLENIAPGRRTSGQTNALTDLKRVLADIDTLPFKNTCQLEMIGLNESTNHPYKINQAYDGTERRGDPLHWAFCYSNVANNAPPASIRTDRVFQRVFQDAQVDYTHPLSSTMHRRFDMKSMYNDDLLNLHCALHTTSLIEGGSAVSAFNNTRMMELTLNANEVARLSTATGNTTLTITRMRPVRVLNGVLVADPISADEAKKSFLSLLEVVRTQTAFIHRQKAFNPTLYKMRFHLCSATTKAVPANVLTNKIYDKYIQLMVPKPLNKPISQIMLLRSSFPTQIYDFMTQTPQGPIDDMVFSMPDIDSEVIKQT